LPYIASHNLQNKYVQEQLVEFRIH